MITQKDAREVVASTRCTQQVVFAHDVGRKMSCAVLGDAYNPESGFDSRMACSGLTYEASLASLNSSS
eukprot:scaffold284122_cov32-Tisochrysis_lutea.AAC.3